MTNRMCGLKGNKQLKFLVKRTQIKPQTKRQKASPDFEVKSGPPHGF